MRKAPQCKKCHQHPRSTFHKENCGIAPKAAPAKQQKKDEAIAASLSAKTEAFIVGKTCLTCNTIYTVTPMPEFQDEGAKHGKYDVMKQVPGTVRDYPACTNCLPWQWRPVAERFGMTKAVKEAYEGCYG